MLRSLVCNYVWNRIHPQISRNQLTKHKHERGLALPDFKSYFLAIALNRISDWKYHRESKLWVQLEFDADLIPQLCIPRKFHKLSMDTTPLTWSTMSIWGSLCKLYNWPCNSPLMQLTGHFFLPLGNLDPQFHTWISSTPVLLHRVMTNSGILPISTLLPSTTVSFMNQWKYQQLSLFVKSLPKPLHSISDLTPVEGIFASDQPSLKPPYSYQALLSLTPKE